MNLEVKSIAYRYDSKVRYEIWIAITESPCDNDCIEKLGDRITPIANKYGFVQDKHRPRWIFEGESSHVDTELLLRRGQELEEAIRKTIDDLLPQPFGSPEEKIELNRICDEKLGSKFILHVYGQTIWHDTISIVGDECALRRLKEMIEKALESEALQEGRSDGLFFVNDGEGYHVRVIKTENTDNLAVPYSDEIAKERDNEKIVHTQNLFVGKLDDTLCK